MRCTPSDERNGEREMISNVEMWLGIVVSAIRVALLFFSEENTVCITSGSLRRLAAWLFGTVAGSLTSTIQRGER